MKYSAHTLSLIFVCLVSLVKAQNTTGYQIEGHIKGLVENSKIYLINGGQRKTIDSALVKNEQFILTGLLNEPAHTYLYNGKTNKLADILLDNRPIIIEGNSPVYDSVRVSGSDIDRQWREWYSLDQQIGYRQYLLRKEREELLLKKDTTGASQLATKIHQLLQERIILLKTFVKRYHDKASGAMIATLCTVADKLTKEDYLELYHSLSPPMQQTGFGKEILRQSQKSKPTKQNPSP